MNKRILIISELFFPLNLIGAVRPTKLAKYLQLKGYDVTVFTTDECLGMDKVAPDLPYRVIYAENKTNPESNRIHNVIGNSASKKKKATSYQDSFIYMMMRNLKTTKRQYLYHKKGKVFSRIFCDYVNTGKLKLEDFDFVFSTFGPIGSLLAGMEAKKRNPELIWINDFRDPMVSQEMPKLFVPYYGYLQRKSINLAEHSVTVSNGYQKRMVFPEMKGNLSVIPNGYDKDDFPAADPIDQNDKFSFAYVGTLYAGKRDVSKLFEKIKELIDEGVLQKKDVVFHYAGQGGRFLNLQAEKAGLSDIVIDHGLVDRNESLRIQASVRFLVLATWNDLGEEGVFPGKILEYMLFKKPIVSLVSGRLADSEVTQVINSYRLGVSYESADKNTEQQLYEWLKAQAVQFNNGKPVIFDPDSEGIEQRYDWENIVKRFCELIDG